jgi:hypothetical protein
MFEPRRAMDLHQGQPTLEGAGVRLHRVFGWRDVPAFDPFLLLDDFGSAKPQDYVAGFPWHPHRGIETVTYMLHGTVEHGDSLGNGGVIGPGEIQWMTAGSGIVHQEMPARQPDYLRGLQLWVNLPAAGKMKAPHYRDIRAEDVPQADGPSGIRIKVIAGRYGTLRGPVRDIAAEPEYLDIEAPAGAAFEHEIPPGKRAFAYVVEGGGVFDREDRRAVRGQAVLYGDGGGIVVRAGDAGLRFILVSAPPLHEPVAWRGPIVMNTESELDLAFREYRDGTFLKA